MSDPPGGGYSFIKKGIK